MTRQKGKPDDWSEALWKAYKFCGESDKTYVESCKRFQARMFDYRLDETLMLVRGLMHTVVINEEVPFPEEFKTGIPSVDLALSKEKGATSDLDVYKAWYSQYVEWPAKCLCETEDIQIGSLTFTHLEPWFLSACKPLARRSVTVEGFGHIDVYADAEGENFWLRASRQLQVFVSSGAWRTDDLPLEKVDLSLQRDPDESRKDYINRVKSLMDSTLIVEMRQATEVAQHPKVPLGGRPLDPAHKHEEMLVRRMFGESVPSIAEAMKDALLDKKGRSLEEPERTVYNRTNLIAKHLGFLPPSGEETS